MRNLEKALSKATCILDKQRWLSREVKAKYAEVYVANKLSTKGFHPEIGEERANKQSDIFLEDAKKRIEVKSAKYNLPDKDYWGYWTWTFQVSQIKGKAFDNAVLVAFDNYGKIKHCFVLSFTDLKYMKQQRKDARYKTGSYTYVSFYNTKTYQLKWSKDCKIEQKLNQHPELFRNRWDKIKKT